jgi:CRP-like cAMP-binding protein
VIFTQKRLARTLLLLARYGKHDKPARAVPPISQSTLAEMVGTTRSRVTFFMKKFQRLGFIDYKHAAQGEQLAAHRCAARLDSL